MPSSTQSKLAAVPIVIPILTAVVTPSPAAVPDAPAKPPTAAPIVARMVVAPVSSSRVRANGVNGVTKAVDGPVKYGTLSAAAARPDSGLSNPTAEPGQQAPTPTDMESPGA